MGLKPGQHHEYQKNAEIYVVYNDPGYSIQLTSVTRPEMTLCHCQHQGDHSQVLEVKIQCHGPFYKPIGMDYEDFSPPVL